MTEPFRLTPPEERGLTEADMLERKRARRRASERPRGYAWTPGTGPDGETCGSCRHRVRIPLSGKTVSKCGANRSAWTASRRTDILAGSPACKFWGAT